MVAAEDQSGPAGTPLTAAPTFELERFAWETPDRLELSGTFAGLRDAPADTSPFLLVRSGEQMHRLAAVPDSFAGPPEEGRLWRAAFAWQDAPVAFDVAELHLGADIHVELPEAGAKRRTLRRRTLEVHTAHAAPPQEDSSSARGGTERVSSQVGLLAAQERVREMHAVLQRTEEELTRARDDLKAERERHAAAQERFREGLASVQASAEEALAAEQSTTQQLADELRQAKQAIEAKDATLQELERAGEVADRLRLELKQSRAQADDARAELETSRKTIDKARTDAERLVGRLTASRRE